MLPVAYPTLFSPIQLRDVTIPNRVVMPPMSTGLAGPTGAVTPEQIAFYRERAHGGVGLIIVEFTCVHRASGISEHRQLSLESAANLDGHARLVEAIRRENSVPCIQLQHGGAFAKRHLVEGGMPWSPSDFYYGKDRSQPWARAMTGEQIEMLIEAFGRTAELGVRAGYEAFELHGAHGYLLGSFLSPLTNQRDDDWGGDEERRLKFPQAVLRRVREAIGNRPLIYRLSVDEFAKGGLTIDDTCRIAPQLELAGVDVFHASTGLGWLALENVIEPMSTEEGWRLPYSRRLRQAVKSPVITVGQIRWPETAEAALQNGDADMVALGRPLLADPSWANKARAGLRHDIRPCTSCNYCNSVGLAEGGIACAENPRTGHELDAPLDAGSLRGARAVVIGAGPGGLASALMLSHAGYETELYEARDYVGGGLIASAAPPHKDKLQWYLDFLRQRLATSNVQLRLGQKVTADDLRSNPPVLTVLAAGSHPKRLPIIGIGHPIVFDAYDLLMGDESWLPENRNTPVMVYGGGETGTETAEYVAERGFKVLLVSRSPAAKLARSAEMIYRKVLRERVASNPLIEVIENTTIHCIDDTGVTLRSHHQGTQVVQVSRLLLAQGRDPDHALLEQLVACGVPCIAIGDNRRGGRIGDAVHDAYNAVKGLTSIHTDTRELSC